VPGPQRHLCFIDFDKVFQGVAVRIDHRPPQLARQEPRRLAAAEARLRLKLQRRHAAGTTGDDVRGEKPCRQRQMAAVHHRAGRHGCLPCATSAFPGRTVLL